MLLSSLFLVHRPDVVVGSSFVGSQRTQISTNRIENAMEFEEKEKMRNLQASLWGSKRDIHFAPRLTQTLLPSGMLLRRTIHKYFYLLLLRTLNDLAAAEQSSTHNIDFYKLLVPGTFLFYFEKLYAILHTDTPVRQLTVNESVISVKVHCARTYCTRTLLLLLL